MTRYSADNAVVITTLQSCKHFPSRIQTRAERVLLMRIRCAVVAVVCREIGIHLIKP